MASPAASVSTPRRSATTPRSPGPIRARCGLVARPAARGTASRSRSAIDRPGRAARRPRSTPRPSGTRGPRSRSRGRGRARVGRSRPSPRTNGSPPADGRGRRLEADAWAPKPAACSSATDASWASDRPAADRTWRMAGLPVSSARREVPSEVGELVRDRREDAVVVEAGLADRDDPRVVASAAILPQPASSTLAASCGCTPTAMSIQPCSSASSNARSHDATFQPGTRIRSTPAALARSSTSASSPANRSALRWQWLSIRRTAASLAGHSCRELRTEGVISAG